MLTSIVLVLSGCSEPEPVATPDPVAGTAIAQTLCYVLEKVRRDCSNDGGTVSSGDRTLDLKVEVENEVSFTGSSMLELRIDAAVDGKPAPNLTTWIVGSGMNKKESHTNAATAWGSIYGAAIMDRMENNGRLTLLQSLADQQKPPPAFVVGDWIAYPGWTQMRGTRTEQRPIDTQHLLNALQPVTAGWKIEPDATHALLIHLEVGGTEKRCTLDGQPSDQVCELAVKYDPPKGNYLLRQYFVFAPGPLPEGVDPRPTLPPLEGKSD